MKDLEHKYKVAVNRVADLTAENERLRDRCGKLDTAADHWSGEALHLKLQAESFRGLLNKYHADEDAAESRLATAEAENEGLRARLDAALAEVRERAGDYNALESRLATAEAENEGLRAELQQARAYAVSCSTQAQELSSERDALNAENEWLRAESDGRHTANLALCAGLKAAESRLATLTAENERLRARLDSEFTHDQLLHEVSSYRSGMIAAESRLARAVVLLRRSIPVMSDTVLREVGAFLDSAQPAAPADDYDLQAGGRGLSSDQIRALYPSAASTEAQKAVLDAMGLIRKSELKRMAAERNDTVGAACEAELARREAVK